MASAPHAPAPSSKAPGSQAPVSNFLRTRIDAELAAGAWSGRRWSGRPGTAAERAGAPPDAARIRTRFPPEPNGYLHIGHAKSICLNFGLAHDYGGRCHMRFDDTNPVREEQEYVDAILETVRWLGFDWRDAAEDDLFYASDYFETLYRCAEWLVEAGHAYVDSQPAEDMRRRRGTLTEPGEDSPYRERPAAESLRLLREMRAGRHAEGSHVLRARIDMASPNLNLRDPVLYRIRFAAHHRTGDAWCVYPMYDYAHPISDALEGITHSICTLEFEDHRPFYDWLLARLAEGGFFAQPLPQQIEFARLNLAWTITSKRRLQELVATGRVSGWDDPRMPTLVGLRRRGYTPESIRLFCERIGVSKADSWIDMAVLEQALRDDLEERANRATAVLDPVPLELSNWPADVVDPCIAPVHPQHPERGERRIGFGRHLWIEREDVVEVPPKGFHRLYPGNRVRLRYGHVIECTGLEKDADGRIVRVLANVVPDTKSGTPGADAVKVKGAIHWVGAHEAFEAQVRLCDRLFTEPHPDAGGRDYLQALNPESMRVMRAQLEPSLRDVAPETRLQFERHGYFVVDRVDSRPGEPVFNRAVGLKDSWAGRTGAAG